MHDEDSASNHGRRIGRPALSARACMAIGLLLA
jgi:hypothetical protein